MEREQQNEVLVIRDPDVDYAFLTPEDVTPIVEGVLADDRITDVRIKQWADTEQNTVHYGIDTVMCGTWVHLAWGKRAVWSDDYRVISTIAHGILNGLNKKELNGHNNTGSNADLRSD